MSEYSPEKLKQLFDDDITAASGADALEEVRIRFLGRKGLIAEQFKRMGSIPSDQRKTFGADLNKLKQYCESNYESAFKLAQAMPADVSLLQLCRDMTLPARKQPNAVPHPLIETLNDICDIFRRAGFDIATGPEVESDWYNFTALNVPPDHPAKDMHDTFYVGDADSKLESRPFLLRTHTSPVQIHVMENEKPPLRVIAPGKVYRRDLDSSHTPMFHQVEGLWVDDKVQMTDLKGLLSYFVKSLFGDDMEVRFRPSFFPFTEPSIELDMSCTICGGKGLRSGENCSPCKASGWIEILGAGMVHPNVFSAVKYPKGKYTGLAFGMGVERIAMIRYSISDIRLFYENDVRFMENLS